ncbi:MAG: DUF2135 domain-containing protein [Bdellovibrionales bacterium]|nr:DUF2135 domain-containing protein [Bdellovibrionales bacterium]
MSILLSVMALNLLFAQDIVIENPKSGWRNSQTEGMKFTQQVNYPASSANVPEYQSTAAIIKGKIKNSGKENGKPHQLIVNGIDMPLVVTGNEFSKSYIFGPGSNNVEVRSPDKKTRSRVQFFEGNSDVLQPRLSVILSWDANNTDLDLHVITPDGQHAWYGDRVLKNGGALDIDVTTGYGPEIFSMAAPVKGTYLVYVNYYGSRTENEIINVQVTTVTEQNTINEKKETRVMPMRKPGELNFVGSFIVN